MLKAGWLKKFALVIGFLGMFAIGYMTTSAVTSCPANAQCGCSLCTVTLSATISQIGSAIIVPSIVAAGAAIVAYYGLAAAAWALQIGNRFSILASNYIEWFETFWNYGYLPAMQQQTAQLNTSDSEQARAWGGMADSVDVQRTQRMGQMNEVDSHRESRPGENVCVAATVVGGLARASKFSKTYNTAAATERAARSTGDTGTAAGDSPAADQKERFDTYRTRYCQASANGGSGNAGCAADSPFVNMDIDVAGQIFQKDTIDLTNADVKQTIDDLIINVAEPFTKAPLNPSVLNSGPGREAVLKGEAYKTKRQVVYDALYFVVSKRAPGSTMRTFIEPIRAAAGVPPSEIAANPSQNEVMEAMMSERFRSGDYAISQIDEPENNEREMVIQQAFQIMRMTDQIDLLDKYALILAADIGYQVQRAKPLHTRPEAQPAK